MASKQEQSLPELSFTELCQALTESLRRQLDSARAGEHLGIRSTTQDVCLPEQPPTPSRD
jgi:hypothetical protein